MADTSIEWTQKVWNPIVGCSIHSPGCKNCYAMRMAWRLQGMAAAGNASLAHYAGTVEQSKAGPVWTGKLNVAPAESLTAPLRRKVPTTYFVNSMSDLFHVDVPDEVIDRVFAVMALTPQHTYQVLTKRADRMREHMTHHLTGLRIRTEMQKLLPQTVIYMSWPLPNVWLGVSVEDQKRADERVPDLLATPAAIRWLSCEPLLGPVELGAVPMPTGMEVCDCPDHRPTFDALNGSVYCEGCCEGPERFDTGLDWIVVGGESGKGARPMHPNWARSLRDQCAEAGVPMFFKQWGEWGLDTGPVGDAYPRRDPVMEGARCAVLVDGSWQYFDSGYAPPIELCSGHGEFVYRLGKKQNGRLLDDVEHDGMPEVRHG